MEKIIHKDIDSLIFAEYNPRQLTKEQHKHLKDSISRFGLVDPILVNKNKERQNIIIGGHQRVRIAKELKIQTVPAIELDLTYDKERELNVRLNKNSGEWDFDILANNFELDELIDIGFTDKELKVFEEDKENIEGEIEISPELFERHDYLLFYIDNEFDWQVLNEIFELKTVKSSNTKMGSKGVGRVISGRELIKKING